jgi:ribosomal protein L15E
MHKETKDSINKKEENMLALFSYWIQNKGLQKEELSLSNS